MKQIKAILHPNALPRVIRALHELPRFPGLTVFDAVGQGRGHGAGGTFVLTEENLFFHHKKVVEIIAEDDLAHRIVATIREAAHTGNKGDGLVVVTDILETLRIGSGATQNDAV